MTVTGSDAISIAMTRKLFARLHSGTLIGRGPAKDRKPNP
jgi:hypothetical protein